MSLDRRSFRIGVVAGTFLIIGIVSGVFLSARRRWLSDQGPPGGHRSVN